MKTLKVEVDIPPSRELHLLLPHDVPIGRRTMRLMIDAPEVRAPLELPVHDFGPWPEHMTLRREEWYGDDGR